MTKHYNITGNLTKEIIPVGSNFLFSSIWITNVHSDRGVVVDLYIEKKLTGKFYYLKNKHILLGEYLKLENISVNSAAEEFGLYIKLNDTDSAVDVILK
jgi:hypothetical protein